MISSNSHAHVLSLAGSGPTAAPDSHPPRQFLLSNRHRVRPRPSDPQVRRPPPDELCRRESKHLEPRGGETLRLSRLRSRATVRPAPDSGSDTSASSDAFPG